MSHYFESDCWVVVSTAFGRRGFLTDTGTISTDRARAEEFHDHTAALIALADCLAQYIACDDSNTHIVGIE